MRQHKPSLRPSASRNPNDVSEDQDQDLHGEKEERETHGVHSRLLVLDDSMAMASLARSTLTSAFSALVFGRLAKIAASHRVR